MVKNVLTPHGGTTIATHPRLPAFDEARLAHFEAVVARFRPVFQRADQFLRFRAYMRGLLEPLEPSARKNVEVLAATAGGALLTEANLAQALHHFVGQSPWPSERLFAAVREQSRPRRADPGAVWLVHDTAFPKKGRHSVGVMRQLARGEGRKMNCQVAVVVAQVGPKGYFPLAVRLYLPAAWLKSNSGAAEKGVPEESRPFASKGEIALALLGGLVASGDAARPVTADGAIQRDGEFLGGVRQRGWAVAEPLANAVRRATDALAWMKRELGFDHFEGRNWLGWHHHAALVFAAYEVLAAERGADLPPFPSPLASGAPG